MADDSAQEKTEEATQHKKDEAIKKGDVVHSREVVTTFIVLMAVMTLPVLSPLFTKTLSTAMTDFLQFSNLPLDDVASFEAVIWRMIAVMLPILIPVFLIVMGGGLVANIIQIGWKISTEKLEPKLDRMDPIKGAEKIIGRKAAAEAVRTVAKFLIVGVMSVITVRGQMGDLLQLHFLDPSQIIPTLSVMLWTIAWRIALLMIAFSILDYGYQRWDWNRRQRMSRQELKEEMKDREGNPLIKQRVRSIQMERARQRMMQDVPTATAIVTNPTHCAVAIRYVPGEDEAPIVVAKGVDFLARKIKEIAREHEVPCVEEKPLAWALYRTVKVGREVPANLYQSVAEILAYVFRLGGWERIDKVRTSLQARRRAQR